jgi:hypothetical protein
LDFQYSCRLLSRSFLQMGRPNVLYVKKLWKPNGWLHVISQFIQEKRLFSVVSVVTHQTKGTIWSYILIISIVILEKSVLIVLSALTVQIKERIWSYISINGIGNVRSIFCKVNKIGILLLQIIEPIILENGDSQCPLCQKIMRTKNYFESHIRTHTGEKPFACSACDYAASDRSNLRRHINSKHC